MGRQTGLIKVSGNIGGVSFYRSNGEDLARVANGPSKEKIQNGDNFARTRENNSEFGGSATAAKALRLAFASGIVTMADNKLVSRLTAFFKDICSKGSGTRGQRSIELSKNMAALEGLEFNAKVAFGSVFNAPYTLIPDPGRMQADFTSDPFMPQTYIKAPAGATHFRLSMTLSGVSDYVYNATSGKYEPTDAPSGKLTKADAGIIQPLKATAPVVIKLGCIYPAGSKIDPTASSVLALGIEFFQEIGGIDYSLAQGNSMKIIKVF